MDQERFADNDSICSDDPEIQGFIKDAIEAYTVVSNGVCRLSPLGRNIYQSLFYAHGYTEEDYNTVPKFLEVYASVHRSGIVKSDTRHLRLIR